MKRILILARDESKAKFQKLQQFLNATDGLQVEVASWRELEFSLESLENATIKFGNTDLKDYDHILVMSYVDVEADVLSAIACYCRHWHVKMSDDQFGFLGGKLYSMWRLWEMGVPVPSTYFGPIAFMKRKLKELGGQGILKWAHASRGAENYLVKSVQELEEIISAAPDKRWLLQNLIPNHGDWRVVTLGYEPKLFIERTSGGKDHRNNVSLGGKATLIPKEQVDNKIIELAKNASLAVKAQIAGVDVIENDVTNEYFVLEVNNPPQLADGSYVKEKAEAIKEFIVNS